MACPICKRPVDAKTKPFCSKRCADIDLGRWMTGSYAIPSADPEDADALIDALEARTDEGDDTLH